MRQHLTDGSLTAASDRLPYRVHSASAVLVPHQHLRRVRDAAFVSADGTLTAGIAAFPILNPAQWTSNSSICLTCGRSGSRCCRSEAEGSKACRPGACSRCRGLWGTRSSATICSCGACELGTQRHRQPEAGPSPHVRTRGFQVARSVPGSDRPWHIPLHAIHALPTGRLVTTRGMAGKWTRAGPVTVLIAPMVSRIFCHARAVTYSTQLTEDDPGTAPIQPTICHSSQTAGCIDGRDLRYQGDGRTSMNIGLHLTCPCNQRAGLPEPATSDLPKAHSCGDVLPGMY